MNSDQIIGPRGKQVLRLLHEYGPLTNLTLRSILRPAMPRRKVNMVLRRLMTAKLIRSRYSALPRCTARYVELATNRKAVAMLPSLLSSSQDTVVIMPGGTDDMEHAQECTLWAARLSAAIPGIKITRDFRCHLDRSILHALRLTPNSHRSLIPDLIAQVSTDAGDLTFAIEIERTEKSAIRSIRKLRRLAIGSEVDGVIYITRSSRIAAKLRKIFLDYVLPHCPHLSSFRNEYFVMSSGQINLVSGLPIIHGLDSTAIDFGKWISSTHSQGRSKPK
jgi:hypothetical protein